jgi:hypothetical protein
VKIKADHWTKRAEEDSGQNHSGCALITSGNPRSSFHVSKLKKKGKKRRTKEGN